MEAPDYQVGPHFEALDEGPLVAAFKSTGYFSHISIFAEKQCCCCGTVRQQFSAADKKTSCANKRPALSQLR